MKTLLLKRGDIIREYGVTDRLMRAFEKNRTLAAVKIKGFKRKLYRRTDVEKIILGEQKGTHEEPA